MALIAPTVEAIGDEALTNSIIDRSITELQDNIITTLGAYALDECAELKSVAFGAVTTAQMYALQNCTALSVADFHARVSFEMNVFKNCTALTALILRSQTVCPTPSSSFLDGSAIKSGTGYIYVPAALVDSYKTATNWSTYANQIRAIEDYPEVCSTAGKAWEQSSVTSGNQYHVVYANGLFICLGSSGKYHSVDGKTWKADLKDPSSFSDEGHPIKFANGLWVLGDRGTGLWYSEDGITWTQSNVSNVYVISVAYGNGMWVASDMTKVYYSADGKTWSEGSLSSVRLWFVIYGDGVFVAGSNGTGLYYSEDGVSWSASNITTGTYEYFGDYANGLFVIPGASTTKNVLVSTDGKTWQELSVIQNLKRPSFATIVHKNGLWVGGTNNATGFWYSEDGTTWTRSNVTSARAYSIAYGAGVFVSAGATGSPYYSTDGRVWERASGGDKAEFVAFGGGLFVACTSDSSCGIYYSE